MRVAQFDAFGSPLYIAERDMPVARPHGVVIKVEATGLCRSDWHGWQGHDSDITELIASIAKLAMRKFVYINGNQDLTVKARLLNTCAFPMPTLMSLHFLTRCHLKLRLH
jgi:hypothetical protein